ncbi:dihydrofolate reductase family protein, partial [Lysinibacillus fusiformis]|uniref:dihydrofolate reductase family protein n=1 Tax=Lysinibacillus fusiformis TaxID=28031 RepID=UPI00201CABAA
LVCSEEPIKEKMKRFSDKSVTVLPVRKKEYGHQLDDMLEKLYTHGITDILLEGGSKKNATFLQQGAIGCYVVYIA